jgi:hypothetical protein
MTVPNGAPEVSKVSEAIRSFVGLLVAGFAGALNFIGLKNGEVPVVLRNEGRTHTLILCLIVAGILTAVASIFVRPVWKVSHSAWIATAAVLVGAVGLTIDFTKIPGVLGQQLINWPAMAAGAGIAAAVFLLSALFLDHSKAVSAQGLLVFAAVALTATATYGALRAETVSQLSNTSVQLSATISETGRTASVVLSIDASKMQNGDRVNVLVAGLRRHKNLAKFCRNTPIKANLPCSWAPCFTRSSYGTYLHLPSGCDALSSGIYQPNAAGTVQKMVTIPVSDVRYQGLELIGVECLVSGPSTQCTYSTYDSQHITRVDIQIPKDTAS